MPSADANRCRSAASRAPGWPRTSRPVTARSASTWSGSGSTPAAAPSSSTSRERSESVPEEADLTEDRDRVRVDVLAGDQTVGERDHVHPHPLDLLAGRRRDDLAATHLPDCGWRRRALTH